MSTPIMELKVPDIGDAADVSVIELLVTEGDRITQGQILIVLETDKSTMEIPAERAGIVRALKVKVGSQVNAGSVIASIEPEQEHAPGGNESNEPVEAPVEPEEASPDEEGETVKAAAEIDSAATRHPAAPFADAGSMTPHASPSVRKFARELGISLEQIRGTGARGRIVADDVRAKVREQARATASSAVPAHSAQPAWGGLPEWPKPDFSKFGEIERKDLSRVRKISGAALHRNWISIPHVTNHEDADITELEAFRVQLNKEHAQTGQKFTLLAFIIKACVATLKAFPDFNASLDGEQIILKRYFHIGFAADTPNGLLVPVIRNADQKGLAEIAKETAALAARAREGKLSPAEMSGASFSVSSLGGIGGAYFTPIINAPEVAILGVGKARQRVEWMDGQAQPRLILPLSLSWDHRVVDGAAAGRFNARLASLLNDYRRVAL